MKIRFIIAGTIFILGVIYLTLPTPATPDLSNAVRSDEAGDTWQHPDQKGFYTNQTRAQVIGEMQSKYSIKFVGLTIPSYRLNYRPEESFEFVRDQVYSNYLEEIVYPFRDSLFVNGFEPINLPGNRNVDPAKIPGVLFKGTYFMSKVTIRPATSAIYARLLVWTLIFPVTYLVYISLRKSIKNA